jgi:hypothetical protein
MTGLRIISCARPSLTWVGHRDVGWTLPGQVVFGRAELRHPSCAILGTCILRFVDFLVEIRTHFTRTKIPQKNLLTSRGVFATGSAHAIPSAWPSFDINGKILTHMSGGSWANKIENFSEQFYRHFRLF